MTVSSKTWTAVLFAGHNDVSSMVMNRDKNRSESCCNKSKQLREILRLVSFCASVSILSTQRANTFFHAQVVVHIIIDTASRNPYFFGYKTNCNTTIRQNIFSTFLIIWSVTAVAGRPERGSWLVEDLSRLNSAHNRATVEYGGTWTPNVLCKSWFTCSLVFFFKQRYLTTAQISIFSIFENTFPHVKNKWLQILFYFYCYNIKALPASINYIFYQGVSILFSLFIATPLVWLTAELGVCGQ